MISIEVTGIRELQQALAEEERKRSRETTTILRTAATILAKEMVGATKPKGMRANAEPHKTRIGGEIGRLFADPGKIYARLRESQGLATANEYWAMHKAARKGKRWSPKVLAKIEAMLQSIGGEFAGLRHGKPDAAVHQAARSPMTGRVEGPAKIIAPDRAGVARYARQVQRRVGRAKAAWVRAAQSIGGGRIDGLAREYQAGSHRGINAHGMLRVRQGAGGIELVSMLDHAMDAIIGGEYGADEAARKAGLRLVEQLARRARLAAERATARRARAA
jgi:hypothetical protein